MHLLYYIFLVGIPGGQQRYLFDALLDIVPIPYTLSYPHVRLRNMSDARIMLLAYGRHVIQERIGSVMFGLIAGNCLPLLAPPTCSLSHCAAGLPLSVPLGLWRPLKHPVFILIRNYIFLDFYLRGGMPHP
jgi:hypothetical protein